MKHFLFCLLIANLSASTLFGGEIIITPIESSEDFCEESCVEDDLFCNVDFTPCQIYYFCNTDTDPCIFVNFDVSIPSCAIQNVSFTSRSPTCNKPNPIPAYAASLPTPSSCGPLSTWSNHGMWFDSTGQSGSFNVTVVMRVDYICGPGFYDICTVFKSKTFNVLIC